MLPEPIGIQIARYRARRGLTLEQLAAKMQARGHETIAPQRLNEIELGKRVVRPEELVSLARILGVSISELLGVPDFASE